MRRLVACVILLGLCGCTGPLKTDTALVRDSAGVTIVENFGPAWSDGEAWHTSAEPAVDIGGENADANYNLFQVTDATRLRDGRLVIANAGTNELRFYDQSGRHVRTVVDSNGYGCTGSEEPCLYGAQYEWLKRSRVVDTPRRGP